MKKLLTLIMCTILTWSCSTPNYLSTPEDFKNHVNGLYLEYKVKKRQSRVIAEIIEVKNDSIKLLLEDNKEIITISQSDIKQAQVLASLSANEQKKLNTWAGFLNLASLGHGYFMVFSVPINLVASASTHTRGVYRMKIPNDVGWHELHKFARFPQGIPENIDENLIK